MLNKQTVVELLETDDFVTWLHSRDGYAGTTRESTSCPIATYLSVKLSENYTDEFGQIHVYPANLSIDAPDSHETLITLRLPEWAVRFVEKVDELAEIRDIREIYVDDETGEEYESEKYNDHIPVEPAVCIDIVDEILEELALEEPENV